MAKSSKSAKGAKSAKSAKGARGAKSAKSARGGSSSSGGARKSAKKGGGRQANAAFMRPVQPSDTLAEVVGNAPLPRTELTKKLWAYIKKNGLQDQKNKRMIKADDKLRAVFGKPQVNMFEMTKLVNKHVK
jgi:chromatin remodeling complex protein RSC6